MDQSITLLLNGSHSLYLDGVAWTATQTLTWLPLMLALLFIVFRTHDLRHFLFIVGIVILSIVVADQLSSSLFKPLIARLRPSHEPTLLHQIDIVRGYRGGWFGFFSSHAANTAAVSAFFALLLRHRSSTITLIAWTLINCWTRIYLGVHYAGDLLFGLIIGLIIGSTAYYTYRRTFSDATTILYSSQHLELIPLSFVAILVYTTLPWRLFF